MKPLVHWLAALALVLSTMPPAAGAQDPPAQAPAEDAPDVQSDARPGAQAEESGEAAPPRRAGEPTPEEVQARLDTIAADGQLDPDRKQRLVQLYRGALADLERAATFRARSREVLEESESASDVVAETRARLDDPEDVEPPEIDGTLELGALEQGLADARRALDDASRALADLEDESKRRTSQRTELPARYQAAQTELRALEATLEAAEEDSSIDAIATRTAQRARQAALQAEIATITDQLDTFARRQALLDVKIELAGRREREAAVPVDAWAAVVEERRRAESRSASSVAERASRRVDEVHPALRPVAAENARLAGERAAAVVRTDELANEVEKALAQGTAIQKAYDEAKERDKLERGVRLSAETGALLRSQWTLLPSPASFRRKTLLRQRAVIRLALARERNDASARELSDLDASVAATVEALPDLSGEERRRVESEARSLLSERVELLSQLRSDQSAQLAHLTQLEGIYGGTAGIAADFSRFIERRILWIASAPALWETDLSPAADAVGWLSAPANWAEVRDALRTDAREAWGRYVLVLLGAAALLALRPRLGRGLAACARAADPGTCFRMRPTWQALGITVLLILPVPLLFRWIGWRLTTRLDGTEFTVSVGHGLMAFAVFLALVEIPRQVLRPNGLGESHFDWPAPTRARTLGLLFLLLTAPPFALVTVMLHQQTVGDWQPSAERIGLLLALGSLAVGGHLVMGRPRAETRERARALRAAHAALVGVPLLLCALATSGYLVTALQITGPALRTIVIVFVAASAHSLVHRWLVITRRAATIERMRKEEQLAEGEDDAELPPRMQIDLEKADLATRRMFDRLLVIACGLWILTVWGDVVALGGVQGRVLWTIVDVDNTKHPVTLAALLGAMVGIAVTFITARNLPGVLDLVVLRRLPLRPGDRLLTGTVARYLIILVGVLLCCRALEVRWAHLQWMAAAVSVGLGFGLQEIFANFVSGVIILFERPIRIGDMVTVGTTDGRVTNIGMRATTITDFDRRELIVPNKEFVTGKLVNWTLSDTVTRVVFPVGVSRRSDPEKAREVLLSIARRNPLVMEEPSPNVIFRGFSEDAIKFDLWAYIPERAVWADLLNSLNLAIHSEFSKEGIELAARYQELHVRSAEGLEEVLARRSGLSVEELGPPR